MENPKFTIEQVLAAVKEDDGIGFCVECGAETGDVEPDARRNICDVCGQPSVYAADILLLMMDG